MNSILAVVLDMGGVVIELDWARTTRRLGIGKSPSDLDFPSFIRDWDVYDAYERGSISTDHFFDQLKGHFSIPLELPEIISAWNLLLVGPVFQINGVLERVSRKCPLFGLSNTNSAHYEYFVNSYREMSHFNKIFASHSIGLRKPEKDIFSFLANELSLKPETVLFVDDTLANVEAAKALGFQSEYCFNSAQQLQDIFTKYQLLDSEC